MAMHEHQHREAPTRASQAANIDNEAKGGGGVARTVRSIQAGKSKNAVMLLQQFSDITEGDFARAEILCVCTMIRATKMGAVPAPVIPSCPQAGFKSTAGSHLRPFLLCRCNPGFLPISPCFSHAPAHGTLRTLCDQE